MSMIEEIKDFVLGGGKITKEQAMLLANAPLGVLCQHADIIRRNFCGDTFDLCTIINAKSGSCSENCKFCAQSSFYQTASNCYPLLGKDEILSQAKYNCENNVLRFSLVTSGKRLSNTEVEKICEIVSEIKNSIDIHICGSFGLLSEEQFTKLKNAGVTRIHNNLETSKRFFKNVCTTHSYDDKIACIKSAQKAGLSVCSGGIIGLGETMEDRIDMALSLREIGVLSIPINILNPIKGTPFEHNPVLTNDKIRRIVAIFRFILPNASIRLAGGRRFLLDKGKSCFLSGANSAISGDMLTTTGTTIKSDIKLAESLGFSIALQN
ncbi:MAG: biotin synthase BioB [Oscillospiraceae bacterium]